MAQSLADKVAIVTGGGSGIGEAVSRDLARRGARVVVADINADGARRVAASIADSGGLATASTVDVTSEQQIRAVVEETAASYGHLDYQFNNAGIAISGDARDLTSDQWRRVLDTDLHGVVHGTLAAYSIMVNQGFGHIVNTASGAGLVPTPLTGPYCTAKFGVVGLSLSLRLEGADLGVKVSVVCPGYVRTPIFDAMAVVGLPREIVERPPGRLKAVSATDAARSILRGVERNRPVIAFPRYMSLGWRVACLFPRSLDRTVMPTLRELRTYRSVPDQK